MLRSSLCRLPRHHHPVALRHLATRPPLPPSPAHPPVPTVTVAPPPSLDDPLPTPVASSPSSSSAATVPPATATATHTHPFPPTQPPPPPAIANAPPLPATTPPPPSPPPIHTASSLHPPPPTSFSEVSKPISPSLPEEPLVKPVARLLPIGPYPTSPDEELCRPSPTAEGARRTAKGLRSALVSTIVLVGGAAFLYYAGDSRAGVHRFVPPFLNPSTEREIMY